ncbi:thiamine diphosphokinase [Eggerthella sinensis]|jgi:thiamine pyrophosphokinase|uniref:Thiamine diphosphokinase n=1 Tax=Eggerthella sinensis TaxID=242230 RepID=A0A3N0IWB2_9ACTN|nr:thiamine diphosphokinase [Eggerthella sinensis]MCB7037316.1 thiamine diphosphokinase [Eggerthella sinensis]RDB66676.1 thiamine diphosphokinase [Eggerthella sinensis]RNM41278.1 thiamine diphosphokinase [Eggerthella sinensis]
MTTCALVGAVEFNAADFQARQAAGEFDFVIAVDAGFAHLEAIGVAPDMAVGDFDSLGYVPKARRVSRHPVKKDKSDMELAMEKAVAWDHDELVIYGALGARLDHTLANLQLFARFSERDVYVTAIGDTYAVRLLTGPDVFELPVTQGTVSVFSANDTARGVIERGMAYSLDDEPLSNRTSRGLSNELTGEEATVAVEQGTLYVFYPLLAD